MRLFAALAASTLVLMQSASAQAETFSLDIAVGGGCAQVQDLIERVTARAKDATFLPSGGRWNFLLRIERRANKLVAELHIRGPGNPGSTRLVDGESCEEVTAAVALIVALTLDARTNSAAHPPEVEARADGAAESSSTGPTPSDSASVPAKQPAPVATARRSQESHTAVARVGAYSVKEDFADTAVNKAPEKPPLNTAWRIGIGAELEWTTLFTNSGMWLLGLRGEGARAERLFTIVRAFLGPKVVRDVGSGASAAFSFYGAGLELGTPVVGSRSLATDAMFVASMGGLVVTGVQQSQAANSRSATATWVGLGPGLRLRWFSDAVSVAFQVTGSFNPVRPRFVGSEQVLYQTPSVGIFFGLCGTWNVEPSSQSQRVKRLE
jgi:hypothetical protein